MSDDHFLAAIERLSERIAALEMRSPSAKFVLDQIEPLRKRIVQLEQKGIEYFAICAFHVPHCFSVGYRASIADRAGRF